MRRFSKAVLILAAALSLGSTAVATAQVRLPPVPFLTFSLGGNISPSLPMHEYTPMTANVFGKVATSDGTHPPALREIVADVDRDVRLNTVGLPACKVGARLLQASSTKGAVRVCPDAVVGEGSADVEIAFPEQKPIIVPSPLKVFNGGEKGGKVTLLIHTFITVPRPTAIVTTVTISRKGSGLHTISKIPVIAGGSGSVLDFRFRLKRNYVYRDKKVGFLEGKCPDGAFKVSVPEVLFRNDAQTPGVASSTVRKGGLVVPCTVKG